MWHAPGQRRVHVVPAAAARGPIPVPGPRLVARATRRRWRTCPTVPAGRGASAIPQNSSPQNSSTQYVLDVQPVIPVALGDTGSNLITRPIVPILEQPDPIDGGHTWGWGDIQVRSHLSPASGNGLIRGAGPVLQMPTASGPDKLGTQQWSAGPGAVALANQIWPFAGNDDREDISRATLRPFVNCNFDDGWYVSSSPVIAANWEADGNDSTWTVPVAGGFGRPGKLPVNLQAQAFYNVAKPQDDPTPDWTLRSKVQF